MRARDRADDPAVELPLFKSRENRARISQRENPHRSPALRSDRRGR